MKTIEERAVEHTKTLSADIGATMQREMEATCKQLVAIGYIAGAKEERALLTEWHNPEKELPETDVEVLCMVERKFNTYEVCRYDKEYGWWVKAPIPEGGWCGADCKIIGWRDIHE